MEVLAGYEMGPHRELLLQKYWEKFTMVARAGLYYGAPLKVYKGVM